MKKPRNKKFASARLVPCFISYKTHTHPAMPNATSKMEMLSNFTRMRRKMRSSMGKRTIGRKAQTLQPE